MFIWRERIFRVALAVFVRTAVPLLPETGLENSGLVAHTSVDGRRIQVTLEITGQEEWRKHGL
ncbi:MAG: hypothetical protein KF770_22885 [Anaerolineae bacterium]|nr:hypothetical protein [Anaerolineae bacterium]